MSGQGFMLAKVLTRTVSESLPALISAAPNPLIDAVTPTTGDLLKYWFEEAQCNTREVNFHQGQQQAILNTIYAHEVVNQPDLAGLIGEVAPTALLDPELVESLSSEHHKHPKYAEKMATGSGKTWVLNALLAWQYLNHLADPMDERFTSNFLVVAPGLIVYDRLLDSFQGKLVGGLRDFDTSDMASNKELFVPHNYRQTLLGFLQSSVVAKSEIGHRVTGGGMIAVTNWHLLVGKEDPNFINEESDDIVVPGEDVDPRWVIDSLLPATPGLSQGNTLDVLDRRYARGSELQALIELPSLCVFNDEAHHIQAIKRGEDVTQVEWQKSLTQIAEPKGRRFIQIDFSATPYREQGTGKRAKRIFFPHIIVDFDLNDAMRAGLVKSIALDKREEIAALPLDDLDFTAEREGGKVVGLSEGQRTMLRAGLERLRALEDQFITQDGSKHPKMMVVCEDTTVTPFVEQFLLGEGLSEADVLRVDSNRQGEIGAAQWAPLKERLFNIDKHSDPKVIVSVLMLREGFDVSNICVIVPLRSSAAGILLEQTVGRGLRLMWRGNEVIDEMKAETRQRIAAGTEPTNYFDLLFIIEHPKFSEWYDELLGGGLAAEITDGDPERATGDVERVDLRAGYEAYDFAVPIVLRTQSDEMVVPAINPNSLAPFALPLENLQKAVGVGDRFIAHDVQTGTQYGDYRVDGGIMTATGYNDYLSRMTGRITRAIGGDLTSSASKYKQLTTYPVLQTYQPLLVGWIDRYIRQALFEEEFDPLISSKDFDNWRILLIDNVAKHIIDVFTSRLAEIQENEVTQPSLVEQRYLSEVESISVRAGSAVEARKCIYPKLAVPSRAGGLEKLFIEWLDADGRVEAFAKINEYRHDFLWVRYLRADGLPARYSPDFLVRIGSDVYVVETKGDSSLNDANVQRKRKAALAWCDELNELPEVDRDFVDWHYVLIGETLTREWQAKGARASDLLEYATLRHNSSDEQLRLG